MGRGVKNLEIAKLFFEIADMLAIQKVQWKPQAYRRAGKELLNLRDSVEKIYKEGGLESLEQLPAIGEGIAKKIAEYLKTGKIREYGKIKRSLPENLADISKIPGLGPRRANALYEKLKIRNVADLKNAVKQGKISKLEGFGAQSEQNIAEALKVYKSQRKRRAFKEVNAIAVKIKKRIERLHSVLKIDICGSLRRRLSTIKDIDLLAVSKDANYLVEYFTKMKEVKKILAKGSTKATILWINNVQADLRVVGEKSYGAALLYLTGSKEFNIKMRQIAIKKGYKLSEYGLFSRKTGKYAAGRTEQEVFKKLGMKYVKPEQR